MYPISCQTERRGWTRNTTYPSWSGKSSTTSTTCHEIAGLDPLHADQVCADAPALNARAHVSGLARAVHSILPTEAAVTSFSFSECLAAMRDLGLFLGSIKRHGTGPLAAVPEAEPVLLLLGKRTGMVPRDTVYHYGPWNAPGPRQRMYLGSAQEDALIRSVRLALPEVEAAIPLLATLQDCEASDPSFATICRHATEHMRAMVSAIDLVRSDVTADYFARVMRPYFEDIDIAGVAYFGPAAAHMPLYAVDHILWSADHVDQMHLRFQHETVRYSPPHWRELYDAWQGRKSITTRVVEDLAKAPSEACGELRDSVDALCDLFRVIVTFRGRHAVLARAAYDVGRRLYPAGSGGGTVELLERIVKHTRVYAARLKVSAEVSATTMHNKGSTSCGSSQH